MSSNKISRIRRDLLHWYDKNRRDLPWRRTPDPYAIWIAETMLQQTQVKTVLPYYERFLKTLPSIRALDRAPLRKVLALWTGLGYYRRAENLKKSARKLARNHNGRIPEDYDTLLSLPGIGDYTAGALMSMAFGKAYPAVDGNARRVISRLFNVATEKKVREIAKQLVPQARPGTFNQALMELGASICVSKNPHCPRCPLGSHCAARSAGSLRTASRRTKNPFLRDVEWPLVIVRRRGKLLIRRRPPDGILAGLWELPGGEKKGKESIHACLARHLNGLENTLKMKRRIGELRHSITNRRIRSPIFLIDLVPPDGIRIPHSKWRWLKPDSLRLYPVSSMTIKALGLVKAHEKSAP